MKALIQKVTQATVRFDDESRSIKSGLVLFLGIGHEDSKQSGARLLDKVIHLRIFPDEMGKMNRSLLDVGGELLIVSQFTLYANCKSGRRPSFIESAPPQKAIPLYDEFVKDAKEKVAFVETGSFGAHMEVTLTNDGPVTIILEEM